MGLLNNREIATLIWLFVLLIWMISHKEIRKSLLKVFGYLFRIRLLSSILLLIAYVVGIVSFLYEVNLWNVSLLKDTVLWICFTGVAMLFRFVSSRKHRPLFKEVVVDILKVTIVIEFLVNIYTFSLPVELILLPGVTFVGMLEAYAQTDEKYSSFKKMMQWLMAIIGGGILIYVGRNIILDYRNLMNFGTLRSFLLTPLLSIMVLPFLYSLMLFAAYQDLFWRLDVGSEKSKNLKRFAKREIIKHCRFNLEKIRKASDMRIYNLMQIRNEKHVAEMVKAYKTQV